MAAGSRATASDRRTWAPRKLSFTACAFCAMKITSTMRASAPAIRAARMPLIRVRSRAGAVWPPRAGTGRSRWRSGRQGACRASGGEVCAGMALFTFQGQGRAEAGASACADGARAGLAAGPRSSGLRSEVAPPQPPADVQAQCEGGDDD